MKILSLYIVGFGKFVNQSFDFSKDIVVIKEDNGWGKSTLADFIECMLFGMENARSKTVENNPRIKYAPFTGGAFGGSLTLSYGGKIYRVERQFGKTVAGDRACVYDENNACLSATGKNGEPFGELLLKINRDSYKKCAYISQVDGGEKALPVDTKTRLLSLLSVSGASGGADIALEKLDQAERNLRAKRKPAKGKLDVLDERIEELYRKENECARAGDRAKEYTTALAETQKSLQAIERELEELQRKKEYQVNAQAHAVFTATKEEAKRKLESLSAFFQGIENPESINLDGAKETLLRYQETEKELARLEETLKNVQAGEEQALTERLEETEELVRSYERIQGQPPKAKKRKKRPFIKYLPPVFCALGLILTVFGGAYISATPILGYPLFFLGIVFLAYAGYRLLKGGKADKGSADDGYAQAIEKRDSILEKLAEIKRVKNSDAWRKQEELLASKSSQGKTLDWFFAHFPFAEGYTYPLMMEKLEENITAYRNCKELLSQTSLSQPENIAVEDITTLRFKIIELNSQKTALTEERARLKTALEREEKSYDERVLYASEIQLCEAEKSRLENRLTAIRSARELLVRARENMATKYLAPVESACKKYLSVMGFPKETQVIFTGNGEALLREGGRTIEREYYSVGLNETLDLCLQLALYETLFTGEKPPMILDDPLVNLDDDKTDKAKKLLRNVAQNRQIIYFTCKAERIL